MARRFAGSTSTDKIAFATFTNTTLRSCSVWVYLDALDTTARRLYEMHSPGLELFLFRTDAAGASDLEIDWSGSNPQWDLAEADTPIGQWFNFIYTYDGGATTNDPVFYVDGVSKTATETIAPVGSIVNGTDEVRIGNAVASNRAFDGGIAEFARWDRILTAGEVNALSKGFSPMFFPNGLTFYAPLVGRNSPENQIIAGSTGTVTGAVDDPHPRIIYPTGDPQFINKLNI